MDLTHKTFDYIRRFARWVNGTHVAGELQTMIGVWDKYARDWKPGKYRVLPDHQVQHLGDEWTAEDISAGGNTYGLSPNIIANFDDYISKRLLDPYLPSGATEGLEIGPGGGRLTALLVPRTKIMHLVDASREMLRHLKRRFQGVPNLRYYHTDGMTLPALRPASLDYVIAFDVFVHFEPRLIYWYLRQIAHLLRPGGTAIIHYANVMTAIGWQQFEMDLPDNLQKRIYFGAFGVMCPQLMARFLEKLELQVISADIGLIPRDAIAVFRKPAESEKAEGVT